LVFLLTFTVLGIHVTRGFLGCWRLEPRLLITLNRRFQKLHLLDSASRIVGDQANGCSTFYIICQRCKVTLSLTFIPLAGNGHRQCDFGVDLIVKPFTCVHTYIFSCLVVIRFRGCVVWAGVTWYDVPPPPCDSMTPEAEADL